MKTEYSVECEVCGSYNISPVKCESCWKKEVKKILDEIKVENIESINMVWKGDKSLHEVLMEEEERWEELKKRLGI